MTLCKSVPMDKQAVMSVTNSFKICARYLATKRPYFKEFLNDSHLCSETKKETLLPRIDQYCCYSFIDLILI